VKVEAGSGLPRTRAGRQARVMQMLQMGILSPAKAYKYLDMADFKTLQMEFEADEEQALREHDKLIDGGIINEPAAQQAEMQIMEMMLNPQMDPNTGEPVPFDPSMLEGLSEAGLQPLPFENKAVHLNVHSAYMKSAEFESMPMEARARFYKHYELTMMAQQEEAGPEGQAPRVSLQLRGTVGPTAGSKIINSTGIKSVTPEELLEPPLETVVIDNLDKPNAEGEQGQQDQQGIAAMRDMQESEMKFQQKMRQQMEEEAARINV